LTRALAGIFVGGAGARMGGIAKGLLRTVGGTTIIDRWRRILDGLDVQAVLVGEREEYSQLGIEIVVDRPKGIGPLGGLIALLGRAKCSPALALACDMPSVSAALVERLLQAPQDAPIVAPRREGRWEPFCARYDPARVLPAAEQLVLTGDRSLKRLFQIVGAEELLLSPREESELLDWDTPEDVDDSSHPR
jgi:molybdopterin-guanine dinucleotide biosynthesis protein A